MTDTPEQAAQAALAATAGGPVKTLADIRMDQLEAKLAQLEQINAELRKANQELYAFASQKANTPAPAAQPAGNVQAGAQSLQSQAPAAAEPVGEPAADPAAEAKAREDAILKDALAKLGYVQKQEPDNSGM